MEHHCVNAVYGNQLNNKPLKSINILHITPYLENSEVINQLLLPASGINIKIYQNRQPVPEARFKNLRNVRSN